MKKENLKYGIGFWVGGGVYSVVNMIMNYKKVIQSDILIYNYLIAGVAIFGIILNAIFLGKSKDSQP